MGTKTLIALDTDHIKQYVFPTDKLKEIRGASSLLDRLNREEMRNFPSREGQKPICVYANGGSGMFVVERDLADDFCQFIQKLYRRETGGGASITCVKQDVLTELPEDRDGILDTEMPEELELLRYLLQAKKNCPLASVASPSHPFLRTCAACGIRYAEDKDRTGARDPDERENLYCSSCLAKRKEDKRVRDSLKENASKRPHLISSPLWKNVIRKLDEREYQIPEGAERPSDFNDFRLFAGAKDYLGLIYADGNGMGKKSEEFTKLRQWKEFAEDVDDSIYDAVCEAIQKHLPVQTIGQSSLFPFDLLLLGGDDVLIVTSAEVALDVALTIAQRFREITRKRDLERNPDLDPDKAGYTLSVGVVLAPIKYPFGLLHDLAESTLKYAKREGAKRIDRSENKKKITAYGDTFINFMTVTGSLSQDFGKVYATLHEKHGKIGADPAEFYATLRPYTVEELDLLLAFIRDGKKQGLGRTKLHQVREAVLQMNLTTSVGETRAVLRNWRQRQQQFVIARLQQFAEHYQQPYREEEQPDSLFPRVTFPWFANGPKPQANGSAAKANGPDQKANKPNQQTDNQIADIYRTVLLDFVELYDFVAAEGEDDAHKD